MCLHKNKNCVTLSSVLLSVPRLFVYWRNDSTGSAFSLRNSLASVRRILFICGRCMQYPWEICCNDIFTNQRGHMTKNAFLEGCPCPDDNLRSIISIHLKFSKFLAHIKIWATLNFGRDRLRNDGVIDD